MHRNDIVQWRDLALQKACHPDKRFRYQSSSELVVDFSTPNKQMLKTLDVAPLLERDPFRFLKVLSAVLFIILVMQYVMIWT
jgi:hypothetical protein